MQVTINENQLNLMVGDITEQMTDVIVNAANGTLLGGGGVDGAIHRKAGPRLLEACKVIRRETLHGQKLATGEAVLTPGFKLPADYVIHTVGPVWQGGQRQEAIQLMNCYKHALQSALDHGLSHIAFPSISTGVYHYPINEAAIIALRTIAEFLQVHHFGTVTMVLFAQSDYRVYKGELMNLLDDKREHCLDD